ncbi:Imm43 family immunity protein [Cellulophaga lytica]|uniref:Imm43 family immunity protein n=1 Tax=Cellulophaga lytica TaxID=979 RepID=UPI000B5C9159|nr:DUF1629 domain-containing protein [Cellulophaga lytica]SNQ45104.1 conserved hypothetical protein [Cellulophaga lytica]
MKYYLIKNNDTLSGVPIFLDAVLSEQFDKKDPMPPMRYDWRRKTSEGRKAPFPDELYLVAKNKLLKSDYISDFGGFIVSKEMLKIIEASRVKPFDKVKLNTLGWKGKKITDKEYYFIDYLFNNRLENINYQKSLFAWDISELKYSKKTKEQLKEIEYSAFIKGFKEIFLDDTKFDVFQLRNSKISGHLICNENFKQEVIKNNLYGMEFIELPNLGDLFESSYNYGQIEWNRTS